MWEIESVFIHVTVVPAAISSSSGEKARLPNVAAPAGIATDDDSPPPVGAGDGVGVGDGDAGDGEELLPQAIANIRIAGTTARRKDNIRSSKHEVSVTRVFIPTPFTYLQVPPNIPGWAERGGSGAISRLSRSVRGVTARCRSPLSVHRLRSSVRRHSPASSDRDRGAHALPVLPVR